MFKLHTFAVVVLFWVAVSASLMQVQLGLVASPVYKMRVPTGHSMPIRSAVSASAGNFCCYQLLLSTMINYGLA